MVYFKILDRFKPKEENLFRVKIGGRELSHAEHVGKPERKAPGHPALPPPEPDDSAAAAELAARRAAVIEQQKKIAIQKKKAAELRQKQLAEKRRQEMLKKKKLAELQREKALEKKKAEAKRKAEAEAKRKAEAERRRKADDIYRPSDRKTPIGRRGDGGTNLNSKVPIGARDVGQKYGKQDNRDPGGGANQKMEEYGLQRLVPYLKTKWDEPPDSLLGGRRPEVLIELTIEGNGRVSAAKITKKSGIKAMDESVEILLKKLDSVPAPPERVTLNIVLKTHDL